MRIVRATLKDVFHVHKMYLEYLKDTKQETGPIEQDLSIWLPRFASPRFFCQVVIHGKRYVGFTFGYLPLQEETPKKLEIQAFFIKRGFRGRLSALRCLQTGLAEKCQESSAVALSLVVPENLKGSVSRKGFKVCSLIVERTL